jgi:hypothetical protein
MAEFVSALPVRGTLILEVVAGGLDAIMEALALNVAELLGRRIPATSIMVLTIALLRTVLGLAILCPEQGGRSQGKNKRGNSEMMELHGWIPPCSLCTLVSVQPDGCVVCKSALSKENGRSGISPNFAWAVPIGIYRFSGLTVRTANESEGSGAVVTHSVI